MSKKKENQIKVLKEIIEKEDHKFPEIISSQINDILLKAQEIKSSKFSIEKIKITPEENSLLEPITLNFSNDKKKITFIKGVSSSGKTTIFDKISHFFLIPYNGKSIIKNEPTSLHIEFLKSNGNFIDISYVSSKKNKFDIKMKRSKDDIEYSKIKDTDEFLYNNNLFKQLNCMHFIKELRGDSLFKDYFANKSNLKPLFRTNWLNQILTLIEQYEKELTLSLKKQNNEKEGLDDTLTSIENDKKNKKEHLNYLQFLVNSEEVLVDLFDKLEEIKKKNKLDDVKRREIKKLKKEMKNLRNILRIFQDLKTKNLKSKMDIYIDQKKFKCIICENYIPHKTLKERIKNNYCWICGKFEKNYDSEIDSLAVPEFDNITKEIEEQKKKIRLKKKEIKEIENEIPKIDEIISGYDKKLVKEVYYYSEKNELLDDIIAANGYITRINDELRGISKVEKRIKKKREECCKKISEILNANEEYEKFKNALKKIDEKSIEKTIAEIIKYANQFLINIFQKDDIGKLYYHSETNKLVLRITFKDDDSKTQRKLHFCYEANTTLAQGYNRKIDLALSFALLKLNRNNNFSVFSNFLLIDGLETFNSQEISRFLNDIARLKDIRFYIFVDEIPGDLNSDLYNIKNLKRNKRITKDESLELTTQSDLFEYM